MCYVSKLKMPSTPAFEQWRPITCYGMDFRPEVKDIANIVDELELWDWFKNVNPPEDKGYAWWGHENINNIYNKLVHNPHSGASFAYAMRCIQSIAKLGFDNWNGQPE